MDYEKLYKEAMERACAGKPIDEVFPELRESEDERIRKNCIHFLELQKAHHADISEIDDCIAYLERKKEHQNNSDAPNESSWTGIISSSDKDSNLDELAQEYIDGVKQYHPTPTWDLMQTAVCYGYHLGEEVRSEGVESEQPAEWSEEDENWSKYLLDELYAGLEDYCGAAKKDMKEAIKWFKTRLKSLRPKPHWKPSEEQIEALKDVIDRALLTCRQQVPLESLYNDLQKLL